MKNKPTLSLYMPVYNGEKFLGYTFDSIINQRFSDFELFVYDDGSTDSSLKICNAYAKKDKRIIVQSGENGTSINKMNEFIDCAEGRYIGFIDDDDMIADDYLENMIISLESSGADCAISTYRCIDENNVTTKFYYPVLKNGELLNRHQVLTQFLTTRNIEGFRWNKIYRKEIFVRNNIKFMNIFPADIPAEAKLLSNVNTVILVGIPGYLYRIHNDSDVAKMSIKKLEGFLSAFYDSYNITRGMGVEKEASYYLVWRTINILFEAVKDNIKNRYCKLEWKNFCSTFKIRNWLNMGMFKAIKYVMIDYDPRLPRTKFLLKTVIIYCLF